MARNTAIAPTATLEPADLPASGGTTALTTRVANDGPGAVCPDCPRRPRGGATTFEGCTQVSGNEDGEEFLCEVDVSIAPEEEVASFTLEVASGLSGVLPIGAAVQPVFSDSTATDDSATVELTIGASASGDDDDDPSGTDLRAVNAANRTHRRRVQDFLASAFALGLVRRRVRQ